MEISLQEWCIFIPIAQIRSDGCSNWNSGTLSLPNSRWLIQGKEAGLDPLLCLTSVFSHSILTSPLSILTDVTSQVLILMTNAIQEWGVFIFLAACEIMCPYMLCCRQSWKDSRGNLFNPSHFSSDSQEGRECSSKTRGQWKAEQGLYSNPQKAVPCAFFPTKTFPTKRIWN